MEKHDIDRADRRANTAYCVGHQLILDIDIPVTQCKPHKSQIYRFIKNHR